MIDIKHSRARAGNCSLCNWLYPPCQETPLYTGTRQRWQQWQPILLSVKIWRYTNTTAGYNSVFAFTSSHEHLQIACGRSLGTGVSNKWVYPVPCQNNLTCSQLIQCTNSLWSQYRLPMDIEWAKQPWQDLGPIMRSVDLIVIAGLPPPGLSFPSTAPRHGWPEHGRRGEV